MIKRENCEFKTRKLGYHYYSLERLTKTKMGEVESTLSEILSDVPVGLIREYGKKLEYTDKTGATYETYYYKNEPILEVVVRVDSVGASKNNYVLSLEMRYLREAI